MTATVAGTLLPGFSGTELPAWLGRRLSQGLAGVCLFAENVVSAQQLRELTAAVREANPRAIVAVDEEGGDVTRLHANTGSPFPGNAVLGRLDDLELTGRVAGQVGRELRAAGVNLDLAPDADVNSNPENPVIGVRSFGADPALVARHTAAWVEGLQATGVAACAKHFPGHGDTAEDSHLSLPLVDASRSLLDRRELVPFRVAVAAGVRTVMTSHILLPALDGEQPATFSRTVLGGLLREELGFTGVIVTDALDMAGAGGLTGIPQAAIRALAGGCDLLCIGTSNTDRQLAEIEAAVLAAVPDGLLDAARVIDARDRIAALAAELSDSAGLAPGDQSGVPSPGPLIDLQTVAGAFEGAVPSLSGPLSWVAIETSANIAVGGTPWGPFAAGITADVTVDPRDHRAGQVLALPGARPIMMVGKDNHRHAWVRDLIDTVRSRRAVTVVDMGWPSPDRRYADVATFGASRLVGAALVARLLGSEAPRWK